MKKDHGRKVIKTLSIAAGVVGFGYIIFFVFLSYLSLKEGNLSVILFLVFGILLGGAYIWVAYENITRFSEKSIKMLALILTISISGIAIRSSGEFLNSTDLVPGPYQHLSAALAIPLLYGMYLALLSFFKKISL